MTSLIDPDAISVNISGIEYVLQRETTNRVHGSLLHLLSLHRPGNKVPIGVVAQRGRHFFVQRSPQMFELVILPCYVTGKLHVPKWMCADHVIEELKFWRVNVTNACSCCAEESCAPDNDDEEEKEESENVSKHRWHKIREIGWDFVEHYSSSIYALVFGIISFLIVLLSIAALVTDSFEEVSACPLDKSFDDGYVNKTDHLEKFIENHLPFEEGNFSVNISSSSAAYKYSRLFSLCGRKRALQIIEWVTMIYFTCEIIMRLLFCPSIKEYFKSPLNIIDILATFPFYVEIAFTLLEDELTNFAPARSIFYLIQITRCVRVIRILKLARYIEELRILGETLKSAKDELCMLILFVVISVFIFASVMYQLEKYEPESQYNSIPASCWWGIITLTTVGYGDMVPKTIGGKLITSFACVAGIIITAFPVSILVEHFNSTYKKKSKRMFVIPYFQNHEPSFQMDDTVSHKDTLLRRQSLV